MAAQLIAFLRFMFFGLVPPALPKDWANVEQVEKWRMAKVRWRMFVACALWLGGVLFLFLVPPFYGLLPEKYDRVAWSQDVKEVVKQELEPLKKDAEQRDQAINEIKQETAEIKEVLNEQAEADLLQALLIAKKEQCEASRDNRSAEYWNTELAKLRARYERMTGRKDSVPTDCGKF